MKHLKLFESFSPISENLKYHVDKGIPVLENIFRPHSQAFYDLIKEARELFDDGKIDVNDLDKELFETTDLGKFGVYEGKIVPLDLPIENVYELNQPAFSIHDVTPDFKIDVMGKTVTNIKPSSWTKNHEASCMTFKGEVDGQIIKCRYDDGQDSYIFEAEYKGREVELNKPTRSSGPKKYKVYVKNPKTGRVKVVNFGDVKGGLTAKISDPKARAKFSARMNCPAKKDKMTGGYWSCRLTKFSHLFSGNKTYPGFW
jgi:hypothetical protein